MNYSPQLLHDNLAASLAELTNGRKFLIGLSGGLDSVVLLHAMASLRNDSVGGIELRALHVNHQLYEQANSWQKHCLKFCERLDIEFITTKVDIAEGSGIESAAREARYREFEATLLEGEELLLAHHRDDQMETLLLRLMRGSGSRGLSGIPSSRVLGKGRLLRPLLAINRAELHRYAESCGLTWVEDVSNRDESFDRNYCRHSLLPLIEARWPGYRESWSKSAVLANENEALNQELAAIDLFQIVTESPSIVKREQLLALSEPRQRNVLRNWLTSLGANELGWNQLRQLSKEVVQSGDAKFIGDGFQIICFRQRLYALRSAALEADLARFDLGPMEEFSTASEIKLPDNGRLLFRETRGEGIKLDSFEHLSVRYRQGGESCRLAGRPSKALKKLLHENAVQPWLRSRIPLLFAGDELVYIPGVGVSAELAATDEELGYILEWEQPNFALSS